MSQKKSSDYDMHCRIVAERLGKPLAEVKEIVNHYYSGVLKLTSARMGTMFILPELGQLHFNTRNVDYPIRRLEKKVFFYANVYMHKTKITSWRQQQMFKSRVKLRATMTNYIRSYVYFICCILKKFTDKYYDYESRHWTKTFGNYEKAPFNLAVILGNLLRWSRSLVYPLLSSSSRRVIASRRKLCGTCSMKIYLVDSKLLKSRIRFIGICGKCGCVLQAKTASLSSKCPLDLWFK